MGYLLDGRTAAWLGTMAVGLALVAVGCNVKTAAAPGPLGPAQVQAAKARWPGATAETLAAGRELFLEKCARCHGYPDATAYSQAEWPGLVERMAGNAGLSESEGRDRVWIKAGELLKRVKIKTGATNGTLTEVVEGKLEEAAPVVINAVVKKDG